MFLVIITYLFYTKKKASFSFTSSKEESTERASSPIFVLEFLPLGLWYSVGTDCTRTAVVGQRKIIAWEAQASKQAMPETFFFR